MPELVGREHARDEQSDEAERRDRQALGAGGGAVGPAPASASSSASVQPVMPPPTTTTSAPASPRNGSKAVDLAVEFQTGMLLMRGSSVHR